MSTNTEFYTNVFVSGDTVLYRGIDANGQPVMERDSEFRPTLYLPSKKGDTGFKTIREESVEPIQPGTISDCRNFIKKYEGVGGFKVYGNTNWQCQYIADRFPQPELHWDMSKINIAKIDIETQCEKSFPKVDDPQERVNAITTHCRGRFYSLGLGKFYIDRPDVECHSFTSEKDLLLAFLDLWDDLKPDVTTGWNCLPLGSSVWGIDRIHNIEDVVKDTSLINSTVKTVGPVSEKMVYEIRLDTGQIIRASGDHIFPVIHKRGSRYTNFLSIETANAIDISREDISVNQMQEKMCMDRNLFLEVSSHENTNKNLKYRDIVDACGFYLNCHIEEYGINLDDDIPNDFMYLMGCFYTDAGLRPEADRIVFYNTNEALIDKVYNLVEDNLRRKDFPPNSRRKLAERQRSPKHKPVYRVALRKSNEIGILLPLIADENQKKRLNLNILSRLSSTQFSYFFAGLVDGDGCVMIERKKKVSGLCVTDHKGNDVYKLQELLLWNGCFAYVRGCGNVYIPFTDQNEKFVSSLPMHHSEKVNRLKERVKRKTVNTKAKCISWRYVDGKYLVRVTSITPTSMIKCMDIETNTHYFHTSGVRTHNCQHFDFPYLVGRITNVLSEKEAKRLSPWRIVQSRTSFSEQYGTESTVYKLAGISILDYMDLYMKYMPVKLESYKLDHVAFVELGKRKTENKWDSFREFYKNDFQTFMEYNLNDVALIDDLDRKLRLMELHLMQAYNAKVNFEDVFSQVRTWDALIFNHLKQKNVVVPMMEGHSKDTQYVGAFVKDPQVGMHKWCVSWDCASLYPSCIMSLNISPDTIVEDDERPDDIPTKVTVDDLLNKKIDLSALKKHNLSMAASGQCFRRDKRGFLPEMMQKLFDDRKMAKTKMLDAKKEIEKIDMVLHQRSKESKSE